MEIQKTWILSAPPCPLVMLLTLHSRCDQKRRDFLWQHPRLPGQPSVYSHHTLSLLLQKKAWADGVFLGTEMCHLGRGMILPLGEG